MSKLQCLTQLLKAMKYKKLNHACNFWCKPWVSWQFLLLDNILIMVKPIKYPNELKQNQCPCSQSISNCIYKFILLFSSFFFFLFSFSFYVILFKYQQYPTECCEITPSCISNLNNVSAVLSVDVKVDCMEWGKVSSLVPLIWFCAQRCLFYLYFCLFINMSHHIGPNC